jgi:mannosyltransferase OCH1-like enzyme
MIEKNIFQTFVNIDLPDPILYLIDNLKTNNKEYQYHFYTDNDILDFIKTHYSNEIFNTYSKLQIGAAKADFWRYLILYKYGGVYLDIDSYISLSLDNFILQDDKALVTRESNYGHFVQWCLIMQSGHPILKHTIENVLKKISEKTETRLNYITGPPVLSEAIESLYSYLGFKSLYSTKDADINNKMNKYSDDYARFIGFDFNNNNFIFKHQYYYTLYENKKPWMEEQKTKSVIL